jgi:hypothetical protein
MPKFCLWLAALALVGGQLSVWGAAVPNGGEGAVFPLALDAYQDAAFSGIWSVLKHRIETEPFNLWATLLFLGAVVHTFLTQRFRHWAHVLEERHQQSLKAAGEAAAGQPTGSLLGRAFHFLGEVEAVFGIWVVPLLILMISRFGRTVTTRYIDDTVHYTEAVFVVVIMTMASTRPILEFAERVLGWTARLLGGGTVTSWWFALLTIGPLLGSVITEPAAMTITALLMGQRFFALQPRPVLAYATLGLLFVNISIGGTLTHFAAPPVLLVAGPWSWGTPFMFLHFGWKAIAAIIVATVLHWLWFRKDLLELSSRLPVAAVPGVPAVRILAVPVWITVTHILFMAYAVLNAHHSAQLVLTFLFFLAFYEVTQDYQAELGLRPAILVGFFLAGLVIHGGLQGWWIAPLLSRLNEGVLGVVVVGLTSCNDNAAITFLSTLVPGLSDSAKYVIVAAAVTGGGLTVIANAPNPAGQAILNRNFKDGISPLGLLLGALVPTAIAAAAFFLVR